VKKDLEKEVKTGIKTAKGGAVFMKGKAQELTEEAKRWYKIFELKSKVRGWISELGGRLYELSSKVKNPMLDTKIKLIVNRIKKLETQIEGLERKKNKTADKSVKNISEKGKK
jgi:hypothetical protein